MENTTNINDLPIDTNAPNTYDLPESQIRTNREIDENVLIPETKKVRFEDPRPRQNGTSSSSSSSSSSYYELKEKHKVIILAILFFVIFSDIKVKNYLVSILVVIFGDFIRVAGGGISKVGLLLYSLLYGLTLLITVSLIDLSAIKLAF
jgi:hypothetical protein